MLARGPKLRYVFLLKPLVFPHSFSFSLLFPSEAIWRSIIRRLIFVLDLSASVLDRDMHPTRFDFMLEYTRAFILEWYDQNLLGHFGIAGMRTDIAERIGEMSDTLGTLGHWFCSNCKC